MVTGGLRGIGQAIALAMAGEGAEILIAGRSMDSAVQTRTGNPGTRDVVASSCMPTSLMKKRCKRMITATVQRFGGLDILVNNAGIALF